MAQKLYEESSIIRKISHLKEYSRRNSWIYLNMNREVQLKKFSSNNWDRLRVGRWWRWRIWRMMVGRERVHYTDKQKAEFIQQKYKMVILKPGMQNLEEVAIQVIIIDHRNVLTKHISSAYGIDKGLVFLFQAPADITQRLHPSPWSGYPSSNMGFQLTPYMVNFPTKSTTWLWWNYEIIDQVR